MGERLSLNAVVITDSLMARRPSRRLRPACFRVVSDSSIAELRAHVEQFFR